MIIILNKVWKLLIQKYIILNNNVFFKYKNVNKIMYVVLRGLGGNIKN